MFVPRTTVTVVGVVNCVVDVVFAYSAYDGGVGVGRLWLGRVHCRVSHQCFGHYLFSFGPWVSQAVLAVHGSLRVSFSAFSSPPPPDGCVLPMAAIDRELGTSDVGGTSLDCRPCVNIIPSGIRLTVLGVFITPPPPTCCRHCLPGR